MNKSKHLLLSLLLVSIFAAMSLSARAEEQAVKRPAPKAQAVQPKSPAVGSHPPTGTGHPMVGPGQHAIVGSGHPMGGPGGRGIAVTSGTSLCSRPKPLGSSRTPFLGRRALASIRMPFRTMRLLVDGRWLLVFLRSMDGPPDVVSDIEYVDPSIEQVASPPPGAEYPAPPPPSAPAPPPPGQEAVGGAIGGAVVGGILGGVLTGRPGGAAVGAIVGGTTGAVIGAQAEQRHDIICGRASAITDTRPAIRRCRSPLLQLNGAESISPEFVHLGLIDRRPSPASNVAR